MQIKIERREQVNLYRRQKERRFCDHIPVAAIVKYIVLAIVGFLLFRAGQACALVERGYEALGGEVFTLFLPGFYWMASRIARDILDMRGGDGRSGRL